MSQIFKKYFFLWILVAGAIFSCTVTKPYHTPEVNTDGLYRDVSTTDTTSIASFSYVQIFTDPMLRSLIDSGIKNNPDLLVAYTRIEQSEATYRQTRAAFYPTLNASVGATASKLSDAQGFGVRRSATIYQVGVTPSWEIDLWGRLRSSRRAALASLLQSQAAVRTVQTTLVSDIANYYYTLISLDEQLRITRQTVAYWDTTVSTIRALKEAARVTEAAVVQSLAQRYAAEVLIPDIQQNIRETENALSILLAVPPGPINRGLFETQDTLLNFPTGVPSQLLANRPDVQEAEYNFRYYFELTNVARASFYPTLGITASAGFSSLTPGGLFGPGALAASIGPTLLQPIFNQRLNRTQLEIAKAQQKGAFISFRNAILNAGREVSDALSLYDAAISKQNIRAQQLTALDSSVSYTSDLLRYGFANYTEVITARQSLLQAQLNAIDDRLQRLQARVSLYRSLGGGWK